MTTAKEQLAAAKVGDPCYIEGVYGTFKCTVVKITPTGQIVVQSNANKNGKYRYKAEFGDWFIEIGGDRWHRNALRLDVEKFEAEKGEELRKRDAVKALHSISPRSAGIDQINHHWAKEDMLEAIAAIEQRVHAARKAIEAI